jgi:hypothetical protein
MRKWVSVGGYSRWDGIWSTAGLVLPITQGARYSCDALAAQARRGCTNGVVHHGRAEAFALPFSVTANRK